MVATFLINFERTVFKENVETVYNGLWTCSRLGLVTDLTISTSLCNFSVLVKMSALRNLIIRHLVHSSLETTPFNSNQHVQKSEAFNNRNLLRCKATLTRPCSYSQIIEADRVIKISKPTGKSVIHNIYRTANNATCRAPTT